MLINSTTILSSHRTLNLVRSLVLVLMLIFAPNQSMPKFSAKLKSVFAQQANTLYSSAVKSRLPWWTFSRETPILDIWAHVMLRRHHGATTLGKFLHRPFVKAMASFSGTSSFATDAMRSFSALFGRPSLVDIDCFYSKVSERS